MGSFCFFEMFSRSFSAFATLLFIIFGVGAEMLLVRDARIDGNVIIPWNVTTNSPAIKAEIWEITKANFNKYKPQIQINTTCDELKKFQGQNIKVAAMKDGSLKEFYQILNTNESALYGRTNFTGKFEKGQMWWTILHVRKTDLDLVYLLCLRERDSMLTYLAGYAMIRELNGTISTTVRPTDQPKPDVLGVGEIIAIDLGCLAVVAGIVVVIIILCKWKNAKKSQTQVSSRPTEDNRNNNLADVPPN